MTAGGRLTGEDKLPGLRSLERVLLPVGIILALAAGGYAYWLSDSVWLGLFAFMMTSRFVSGSVPKVVFHDRKIHRTLFYSLWPAGASAIIWLVHSLWGVMWLAVLVGLVGGVFVSILVGILFFRDVATEDQKREVKIGEFLIEESLESDPAAVAMKGRFSGGDWDEIKALPELVFWAVASADGEIGKREMKAWASQIVDGDTDADPLLRAMLLDQRIGLQKMAGTNDALQWVAMLVSRQRFQDRSEASASSHEGFSVGGAFDMSTGDSSPHALQILQDELSQDELRSFMNSLFKYGVKIAHADGKATPDEMKTLIELVGLVAGSRRDLLAILGVDEG